MSRSRKTLEPEEKATREQAERLLGEIAASANRVEQMKATLERELQDIREIYSGLFEKEKTLIKDKTKLLKAWAEASPQEFGKSKSIKLLFGTIGWRKTTPTVGLLSGRKTGAVVKFLQGVKRSWIRSKPELDKDRILADFASGKATKEDLAGYGLKVTQQNRFYVDPKLEEVEP